MIVKNADELLGNAQTHKLRKSREILIELIENVIESANPSSAIRRHVRVEKEWLKIGDHKFDLGKIGDIVVVGGGKASAAMAEALEEILGDRIARGMVNIPEGTASRHYTRRIELTEAGHPFPTDAGVKGAKRMLEAVGDLSPRDLMISLISGGGSALVPLPTEGITLDEIQKTTQLLLKSGATIREINTVRKHLSRIKGGQLARAAYPASVIGLLISDVVGDSPSTIASGPTSPDPTTFSDALAVLGRYGLLGEVPRKVLSHLKKGVEGKIPETPKPREECFRNVKNVIVASNSGAIEAARRVGKVYGLNVSVLTTSMQGEAREAGAWLASIAKEVIKTGRPVPKPALLLSGGETTVTVRGKGIGGRNQELVLGAVMNISGLENVTIASFATDGVDGPTNAAGAVADGFTLKKAESLKLDPISYLERNDSYRFFKKLGDTIVTGPTRTNIMDMVTFICM